MLQFLPQELLSLIVKLSVQIESFTVVGKYKRLSKYFYSVVSQDPSLSRSLELSRVKLADSSLENLVQSLCFRSIKIISLKGNREITFKSLSFLIRNTKVHTIDVQECIKVDLFSFLKDLEAVGFSSLQLLKVLHSGQGKNYICRVSIGNLVLQEKNEILSVI
jgi:hypothetical protein